MVCADFCVRYHPHIHRKNLRMVLLTHHTDRCVIFQKILGNDGSNFLSGLCHTLFYHAIIRAHGDQTSPRKIHLCVSCNPRDLDQKSLQFSKRMQWFRNTVPSFLCNLHGIVPSLFLHYFDFPVVNTKNLLNT